jgi:hypothetical protein
MGEELTKVSSASRTIIKNKYSEELWARARELVEEHPEITIVDIAKQLDMPVTTLQSRASRNNWFIKRDINDNRATEQVLNGVVRNIAYQINDMYQHAQALLETLQYTHRIKITRDEEGNIHYRNFEDWPDKPEEWIELSEEEKEGHLKYISPPRFKLFIGDLLQVTSLKSSTIEFIAKSAKASLPKLDPSTIEISRRDGEEEMTDGTNIFSGKKKPKGDKDTQDAISKIADMLKGDED